MQKYFPLVVGLCLLLCVPSAHAGPRAIHFTIDNRSGWNCTFLLSGKPGLETSLPSATHQGYTVYAYRDLPPTITVHQINSGNLSYTLRDEGSYQILLDKRGKLVVTFKNED